MHHIIHAEGVRKCLSTSTSGLPVIRSEPFTGHKLTLQDSFKVEVAPEGLPCNRSASSRHLRLGQFPVPM